MADWNATQYLQFQKERTQPAIDLAQRIGQANPRKILDIGCGPGNSTQVLAQFFPGASILGVDSSLAMIETAQAQCPTLAFMLCDAGKDLSQLDHDFDIVFSNACIQWIPNHQQLLKNMLDLLAPGGRLAVQTPMNFREPIHIIINELVLSQKWKSEFPHPRIFHNLRPDEYFDLLADLASDFSMWETVYFHTLQSHRDIMEWYRSTGLRPYLAVLSPEQRQSFEADVLERIIEAYPLQKNGALIFRFPRFFFVATAKAGRLPNDPMPHPVTEW